jgi:hypothetical protein
MPTVTKFALAKIKTRKRPTPNRYPASEWALSRIIRDAFLRAKPTKIRGKNTTDCVTKIGVTPPRKDHRIDINTSKF